MNRENIVMRDLCDTLMQSHASTVSDGSIGDAIVEFRMGLTKEQSVKFNSILDRVNEADSNYAYETFRQGVIFATIIREY